MKLRMVPARQGAVWVKMGMRTFFKQPLALSGLFFLFMAAMSVLSMVPVLGSIVALTLLPAATLGQTLGALALPELGVSVVNLRNRVGHALSVHDTSVLAEGDTLVLSGAPPALALAEERLLRG